MVMNGTTYANTNWDLTTGTGGITIDTSSQTWKITFSGTYVPKSGSGSLYFNVLDYGAKGDGSTDDTAAIQGAINSSVSLNQPSNISGRVFFPPGQYVISSAITLPTYAKLEGALPGSYGISGSTGVGSGTQGLSVLQAAVGYTGNMIELADMKNYCEIRNIAIDGKTRAAYGVHVADGATGQESQHYFERMYVTGCTSDGFYFGVHRRDNIAFRCVSYSNSGNGFNVTGSDHSIQSCISGDNGAAGVHIAGFAQKIWGCDIFGNTTSGIIIDNGSEEIIVQGNGIDNNQQHGLYIGGGAAIGSINSNVFHSNSLQTTNAYSHIKVDWQGGANLTNVNIVCNTFGPLDTGVTSQTAYAIQIVAGATPYCVANGTPPTGTCGGAVTTWNYLTDNLAGMLDPVTSLDNEAVTPTTLGLLGWSFDPVFCASSGVSLYNTGPMVLVKIMVPKKITITNICYSVTTAGSSLTTGESIVGLYSSSGTQLGLSTPATTLTNFQTLGDHIDPLTTPVTVSGGPGVYVYVAFITNGGTAPLINRGGSGAYGQTFGQTASTVGARFLRTTATYTTTPPASFTPGSGMGGTTYPFWAAIS